MTTRLGTRPMATMAPFITPQAAPIMSPTKNTTGIGIPWLRVNRSADK